MSRDDVLRDKLRHDSSPVHVARMTTRSVPRIGRILDLLGLLVFATGAALYARAWIGLRGMDRFERAEGDAAFAAIERADALSSLGRIGIAIMIAGVLIAGVAALVARRIMARRDHAQ